MLEEDIANPKVRVGELGHDAQPLERVVDRQRVVLPVEHLLRHAPPDPFYQLVPVVLGRDCVLQTVLDAHVIRPGHEEHRRIPGMCVFQVYLKGLVGGYVTTYV